MESTLVIKVKYGDTLRRFSARVDENNRLDLNMVGLRAKICSIFNFTADANFTLRYVDEDGDLVTLVDDDDLHDVMRQQLKFLKIDVHMINDSGGKSNVGSGGSATPLRSPVSTPNLEEIFTKSDVLNSLPEPFRELLYSSISKAASSSPVLANLADSISKIGQSILNSHSQPHVAAGTSSRNSVPEEPITSEARGPQSPCVDSASNASGHPFPGPFLNGNIIKSDVLYSVPEPVREALSNLSLSKAASSSEVHANHADSTSKMGQSALNSHCQPHVAADPNSKTGVPEEPIISEAGGPQSPYVYSASNASRQVEAGNIIRDGNIDRRGVLRGKMESASSASGQVDTRNRYNLIVTRYAPAPVDLNSPPCDPYLSQSTNVNSTPLSSAVPAGDGNKGKMSTDDSFGKGESCGTSTSSAAPNNSPSQTTALSSGPPIDYPFSRTYTFRSVPPPPLGNCRIPSYKRSHSHTEAMSGMFHKGVRCDGCGVYPITGPRFKSKIKENYDLCCICFTEMGNETDYIRMDRPSFARGPQCRYEHAIKFPTLQPHIFKSGGILKHAKPKLDSRFILDVNVIDGTMMAPSTAFTKIWRMCNNGTSVWPKGTQLVWIGGDKFSDCHSVDLEVPEDGVYVEKELDIAVDFRAPQLPGRYISYWRMASPSGHKFGQRVWVLIQVDASLEDSFYDSSQGLNLNIPLDFGGSKGPQVIDMNRQPIEDDTFLQPLNPNAPTAPTETVNQMVDKEPRQELGNEFPINEAAFVGSAASPTATFAASSSVPYPITDFSETAPAVPSNQQTSVVDALPSSLGIGENNSVEESLLKELEEMGFRQVDLNREVLRMNEYDLEQSVDDLCGVSEWDPILEELQEMGFRDNERNKQLLVKNNGSIKRVVMDLINGE
ncbi:Zinc finger, ZZ-type [Sesbania bispinosa]|nr:Zinc finger, ZZ-type [Sesbania bispinosa]